MRRRCPCVHSVLAAPALTMLAGLLLATAALLVVASGDSPLYHALPRQGNVAYSPFGVDFVLRTTAKLAQGAAREQLEWALAAEGCHNCDFLNILKTIKEQNKNTILQASNALFVDGSTNLRPEVLALTQKYFYQVSHVDFVLNADAAKGDIFLWLHNRTRALIDVVDLAVSHKTRVAALASLFLDAPFARAFVPSAPQRFHAADGDDASAVPMLETRASLPFGRVLGRARAVAVPFDGGRLELLLVLPRGRNALAAVEERMRATTVAAVRSELTPRDVIVQLPRFAFATRHSLESALISLGVVDVFAPGALRLADEPLTFGQVVHTAALEVNAQGARAAAVTEGAFVTDASAVPEVPGGSVYYEPEGVVGEEEGEETDALARRFTADHPFLFFVFDRLSGQTLFQGRVTNL